ncbi:MAG: hypothetical protein NT004_01575 [Bacteroidetes bacterium]|nr:hypothetical protein [Bacteroidota bacterium]
MDVYDIYIEKYAAAVDEMYAKGRKIKFTQVPSSISEIRKNICVKVGEKGNSGVILREDTFIELGNPEMGSCSILLYTDKPAMLNDGRITLTGPDINDSGVNNLSLDEIMNAGSLHSNDKDLAELACLSKNKKEIQSFPFAQIIMIGGKELTEKDFDSLREILIVGDQIEGYMVRSFSENIWSRVSKHAVAKGFNFETLGKALMILFKSANPKIESMEVGFVTTNKDDISILKEYSNQIQKISKEIVKENWKIKGYEIDCNSDCNTCDDKPVCDDIREVLKDKMKKNRT